MKAKIKTIQALTLTAGLVLPAVVWAECVHEPGTLAGWFLLGVVGLVGGGFTLGLGRWLSARFPKKPGPQPGGLRNAELSQLQRDIFGSLENMEKEYERMVLKSLGTVSTPAAGDRRQSGGRPEQAQPMGPAFA